MEEKKEKLEKKKAKKEAGLKNVEEQGHDYGDLVKGVDIIDDEISTSKAFKVFRKLEEEDHETPFTLPELETGGLSTSLSRLDQELPSVRIERMRRELDEL